MDKNLKPFHKFAYGIAGLFRSGEATSIALASEFKGALLIIDESKGRKVAKELGVAISGSLGVLVAAKRKGVIDAIKPVIEKIKNTNFRLSDNLIKKALFLADEA